MTMLIGLAGPARSGKDTVANAITAVYLKGVETYAFAYPLKEAARVMFGFDDDQLHGDKKELQTQFGKSPREIMQLLGTEFGREMVDPNLWLKRMHDLYKKTNKYLFLVTDVRFENEAEYIRNLGGTIIHVSRPDAPKVANHKSEQGVEFKKSDSLLYNNGSINDLQSSAVQMVSFLIAKQLEADEREQNTNVAHDGA